MLGVEGYGSDSDSDTGNPKATSSANKPVAPAPVAAPSSAKKSSFALPPPKASSSNGAVLASSSALPLPPPKTKRTKKITIGLPELAPEEDKEAEFERPPAKKPRLENGARSSALLGMLPAPKNKAPIPAAPERVLGGGRGPGLVFKTAPSQRPRVEDAEDEGNEEVTDEVDVELKPEPAQEKAPLPFLPTSLARGKANISVEEKYELPRAARVASSSPPVDFFSLGSSSTSFSSALPKLAIPKPISAPSAPLPTASSSALPLLPGVSSAPKIDDFTPPEPTKEDPYPGYYMLPNGSWAAYDSAYYKTFYDKWKKEYDAHVRALEKGAVKGFEGYEDEAAQEVNAQAEMEKAKLEIQDREEKKALTKDAGNGSAAPKMNIKGAALGGRARTRHQLSTLLTEAYQNREALEERIAMGRRNRKEAGNKYGF